MLAQVATYDLWPNIGLLVGPLAAYMLVVLLGRWRLTKAGGLILLGLYVAYVLWEVLSIWVFNIYGNRDST